MIARAAVRERLTYDFGPLGWAAGATFLSAAGLLRAIGRGPQAFGLLVKAHQPAFSPHIDRRIVSVIAESIALERRGRPTGLWAFLDGQVREAADAFRKSASSDPRRLIGSRILVIKSATSQERGVLVADYQYVFPLLAGLFDLPAICDRYEIVLEPSWVDVCAPEVLLFTRQQRRVYVQSHEPRDHAFLQAIDSNLHPVPLAANWWVDPRFLPSLPAERDIDVIMVAAWADIKRHWRVFRALSQIRRRGRKLKTVLVGYQYDRTRQDIEDLAAYFGIRDQIETYERIPQREVFALLARSKVHVLWSRRESSNRAIIEAMMADVPVIVRDGLTFGYRYPHINEHTGRFVKEQDLADSIVEVIETRERFSPREWVLENRTCVKATSVLEDTLRRGRQEQGECWIEPLVVKTSELDTQRYYNPEDRNRFDADYRFLESKIRR
jgi:glycosyltransferase involved in cell wall biosynthesis